ncbi:response regulator, partial [Chamaesiphon sp. OTE_20_metabat_361]
LILLGKCVEPAAQIAPANTSFGYITAPKPPQPQILAPQVSSNLRILVAEDNKVNQKVALNQLKNLGYTADLACDGEEVLAKIAVRDYDVILMDCHMPRLDGYAATKEIRIREGNMRHTAIVALTASAMKEDRELAMLAGMDDFLSKPVRKDELSAKITHWTQELWQPPPETIAISVDSNSDAARSDLSAPSTHSDGTLGASVDIDYLRRISEGDLDFERQILQVFVENTQAQLRQIHVAIANHDSATIEHLLHTIESASANVGAVAIQELIGRLDKIFTNNLFDDCTLTSPAAIYPLLDEIEYLTTAISQMHQPQIHLGEKM